jgi:hypothetical protein
VRLLVIAVGAAIALAPAVAAAELDGDRVDRAMDKTLDEIYQRDLPGWDPGADEVWTGDFDGNGRRIYRRRVDPSQGGGSGGGSGGSGGSGDPYARDPWRDPGSGGSGGPWRDPSNGGSAGSGSDGGSAAPHDGVQRTRGGAPGDPRGRRRAQYERNQGGGGGGGAFGDLASMLLWGLLVVAIVLVIAIFVREMSGMKGKEEPVQKPGEEDDGGARLAAVIERPRDDADQLAHEGRFADAIHVLLLRTLHELASQSLVRVTPAMTSREVLARVPLLGDARDALAGLVTAVELTWFGDDVPGPDDYARCRQQFQVFATAYRRGAQVQPQALGAAGGAPA